MAQKVRQRSEIPVEYTWDTAGVYGSHADWEAELAHVEQQLPDLAVFQGQLGSNPDRLAEWLDIAERLMNTVARLYFYASMLHNVDTNDQAAQADHDRAIGIYTRAFAATAFAEPELLTIGFDT